MQIIRGDIMAGYTTNLGKYICESSLNGLDILEDNSINLIVTSPPFSNQRKRNIQILMKYLKTNMLIGYCNLQKSIQQTST